MTYEVTIASAGGDDPIMAKSFIMACEGPVAIWYSYDLKNKLRQDFEGFKRDESTAADNFQCLQQDKEPLYDCFQRVVQKKA
jgi:hypothetical protein